MVGAGVETFVLRRLRWVDWELVMPLRLKGLELVMPLRLRDLGPAKSMSCKAGMQPGNFAMAVSGCKAEISADS
jgi:hypothetical protein